jgi:PAS domain S-box-containing protein
MTSTLEVLARIESLLSKGAWESAHLAAAEAELDPEDAPVFLELFRRLENNYKNDFFSRSAIERLFIEFSDPCIITDAEANVRLVNPKATSLFGKTDIYGKPITEFLPVQRMKERILQRKKGFVEFFLPSVKRFYEAETYPLGNGAIVLIRDVTLQKNSERAFIINDRNLKAILNSGTHSFFLLNEAGIVQTLNKNATELMKTLGAKLPRKARLAEYLSAEILATFECGFERALKGEVYTEEVDLSPRMGRPFFLRMDFNPVMEIGQKSVVAGVCLCVNDVTAAQSARNELLRSELRFRSVVQNAMDGIAILDDERRIKYAGPSFLRFLGIERALGFKFSGFLPDREKEKFEAAWQRALHERNCRLELFTRTGRYLDVILSHLPEEGMVFNARDVTEKKEAEERLLMLREAVRHASDAIIITESHADNRRGGPKILYANPSFETINGLKVHDVIGKPIGHVFDEKLAKLFDSQTGGRLNAVYSRPDCTTYEVEWAVAPLRDSDGRIVKKIAVQRDATERNALHRQTLEKERAVLQALINGQELERKRISEDLHDGLGSVLSVLKMSFSVLKAQIENGPELLMETLKRIEAQLDAAAEEARNISSNLSPGILNDFGMVKAVEALKQRIESSTKIRVDFTHSGWDEYGDRPDSETLIGVYRVLQEILNNALKHSFASRIRIEMTINPKRLKIVVADDGVGFDKNQTNKGRRGMGLSNIHTRISILNGKSNIVSKPGRGTLVTVSVPTSRRRVSGK